MSAASAGLLETPNPSILRLKGTSRVAVGHTREVYQHPHADHLLIKVMRFDAITRRWGRRGWLKAQGRYGYYYLYHRELTEYIAIKAHCSEHPFWLQRIEGFVDTDLGWGMVVEKLTDREGRLAPTLGSLVARGAFTRELEDQFERFVAAILDCPAAVISNLQLRNILLAHDRERGDQLVLIDGLGETLLIPLRSLFPWINRWNTRKRVAKLRASLAEALQMQSARVRPD